MSLIKRLSATVFARLDGLVSEIEDHEAVVRTSIDELRHKVARARARLNQLQREETRLQQRIDDLADDENRWEERARACAADDEAKALACLERRQGCRREAERLREGLANYREAAERLRRDIDESEARLQSLSQRHALMRARQSGAEARLAGSTQELDLLREVEGSFERWELRLTEQELAVGDVLDADPLDTEFNRREHEADLRAELDALLKQEIRK